MMAKRMGYRGSDPTALKAIARVYRQEEWKRRQEEWKRRQEEWKRRQEVLQELEERDSRRGGNAHARVDQEGRR